MAARAKSKVTPKFKTKYKVKNWPTYEAALRKRGDITVWFDRDAVDAWNAPANGRPGGQRRYSDLAIVTALTLPTVFQLPLRHVEGFLSSLIQLMGLDLDTPDHTALSRRSATVEVPEFVRRHGEAIHLTVDSTALKIMGNGEWHAHKHKTSNKRRAWRKLHLAVDSAGFIIASELTDSSTDDASVGVAMIERIESTIGRFDADGAYDTKAIYAALHQVGEAVVPTIVIPPRKTASVSVPPDEISQQRDAAIARIVEVGRREWRKLECRIPWPFQGKPSGFGVNATYDRSDATTPCRADCSASLWTIGSYFCGCESIGVTFLQRSGRVSGMVMRRFGDANSRTTAEVDHARRTNHSDSDDFNPDGPGGRLQRYLRGR
ncbi:MAG: hypothetical protein ACI9OJ_004323 [Myxococcota bacterium]|jgi:hypothetical protein